MSLSHPEISAEGALLVVFDFLVIGAGILNKNKRSVNLGVKLSD